MIKKDLASIYQYTKYIIKQNFEKSEINFYYISSDRRQVNVDPVLKGFVQNVHEFQ